MDDIVHRLEHIRDRLDNLHELALTIREILLRDNRRARLAGLDKDGLSYERDIEESTRKWRRRTGRDPYGPALAPDGGISTLVGKARCDVYAVSDQHYVIVLYWDGAPWLKYHVDGSDHNPNLPIRDPVGITPEGQDEIRDAVSQFLLATLAGE